MSENILTHEQRKVALHIQNKLLELLPIAQKEGLVFADEIADAITAAEAVIAAPRYAPAGKAAAIVFDGGKMPPPPPLSRIFLSLELEATNWDSLHQMQISIDNALSELHEEEGRIACHTAEHGAFRFYAPGIHARGKATLRLYNDDNPAPPQIEEDEDGLDYDADRIGILETAP